MVVRVWGVYMYIYVYRQGFHHFFQGLSKGSSGLWLIVLLVFSRVLDGFGLFGLLGFGCGFRVQA